MANIEAENDGGTMGKDGRRPSVPVVESPCAGMRRNKPARTRSNLQGTAGNAVTRLPRLGVHRATGQARVTLSGTTFYCGRAGSVEAHERYAQLVKEWLASGRQPMRRTVTVAEAVVTIGSLFDAFLAHADASGRYHKAGRPTSHRDMFAWVRESLLTALGNLPVAKMSEATVLRWRDVLEQNCRRTRRGINRLVGALSQVLRWGRPRGLVPKHVVADVSTLEPLRRGEVGDRPETARERRAVGLEEAEKVAACASPQIGAMIRLQALTGMRPGEVAALRWQDIDKTPIPGDATGSWTYRVAAGKTSHHGRATRYFLPPAAQKILEQFPATPLAFVFSPVDAMAERRKRLRASRRTPPSKQMAERDAAAQHAYSGRWAVAAYRRAVSRACAAAGVEPFGPHCLRHGFATWAANALSLGAAAAALNHSRVSTTQGYVHERQSDGLAVAEAMQRRAGG